MQYSLRIDKIKEIKDSAKINKFPKSRHPPAPRSTHASRKTDNAESYSAVGSVIEGSASLDPSNRFHIIDKPQFLQWSR